MLSVLLSWFPIPQSYLSIHSIICPFLFINSSNWIKMKRMGGPWYNRRFKQIGQDFFKYHVTLFVTGPRTPSVELNGLYVLRSKIFSQILEFDSKKFATKIESHSNWEKSWVFLKMSKLLSTCLKRLTQHSKWLPGVLSVEYNASSKANGSRP